MPREGLSSEAVYEAVTRVLEDDSFRTAAAKLSQRICSRKRMPLQEAAGERPAPNSTRLLYTYSTPRPRKISIYALIFHTNFYPKYQT